MVISPFVIKLLLTRNHNENSFQEIRILVHLTYLSASEMLAGLVIIEIFSCSTILVRNIFLSDKYLASYCRYTYRNMLILK